jgi:uncharacterized protein (TIGR00255 family)
MLHSMTGIGRAESHLGSRQLSAEIRSLNGKSLDLNLSKLPASLRSREPELRRFLAQRIVRGTVELSVSFRQDGAARPTGLNTELAGTYFRSLQSLAESLGVREAHAELLAVVLRLPDVMSGPEAEPIAEDEWQQALTVIGAAVDKLMSHRRSEGEALAADLSARIDAIEAGVAQVIPLEGGRMERVKARIMASLTESGLESKDPNRFEQELIYYLEKMDISEEKTRLAQHCRYFREVMANGDLAKGKVLGFILQEIGREINTMGSKANDAGIQQIVVGMKDELEKAKEQVLNVL